MGQSKRRLERNQGLYDLGVELCIKVDALAECEFHPGSYYDGGGEVEEAYKLANSLISKGEIEIDGGEDRKSITDSVKAAYEDNYHASQCGACEKNFRRD